MQLVSNKRSHRGIHFWNDVDEKGFKKKGMKATDSNMVIQPKLHWLFLIVKDGLVNGTMFLKWETKSHTTKNKKIQHQEEKLEIIQLARSIPSSVF